MNGHIKMEAFVVILVAINVFMRWFILAQGTKRCHDRDSNGWWQFIPLYKQLMSREIYRYRSKKEVE
ncbi:uncharacterized membrane protein YhaH (DUF805 family) [Pedobacter sp. AK017]|uniref:DUF805 domain-containing protein n=1 Tax=Pedobacter sp. AK017 TaxID=2723073 RepID=UPI001619A470|nr:DUF805 domain-containing protein [Pedobacter sp. AK017]MBB5438534.1 uncharacterized membrane protein YhaH (DUF805 family) [Pedobacter sp. AK017]